MAANLLCENENIKSEKHCSAPRGVKLRLIDPCKWLIPTTRMAIARNGSAS
jgi:hypothetical protein